MPTAQRRARMTQVAAARQAGLVVVLEDMHDPHNAQAAVRSCDAFGVQRVHLIFVDEAPFDPRRVGKRSSSTANKWVDVTTHRSTAACAAELRGQGYAQVAAVADPRAAPLTSADLRAPRLALWFGNEQRGLSPSALAAVDQQMTIPTVGMVRSLNLSVAAAIVLYEAARQRSDAAFRLSPAARDRLACDLLRR